MEQEDIDTWYEEQKEKLTEQYHKKITEMEKKTLNLSKFLQIRINSFIYKLLPFSMSRIYLALLGKIYYLIKNDEKKLIQNSIIHVFGQEKDQHSLKKIINDTFYGIFDHYHEKLFITRYNHIKLLNYFKKAH